MDAPFPTAMMPDIQRFFADVHPRLRPARVVYAEVFATELFFPLQRKRELARMLDVAGQPVTVMEIGADKGGGLYHWCMLPSVRNVIACEIRGTPYMHEFERAFPDIDFYWVQTSSYAVQNVERVAAWLKARQLLLDVLFIDGDKTGMLKDFTAYKPLMQPRGVMFLHDVRDSGGPREAWAALSQSYRTEHIVDESEYVELRAHTDACADGRPLTPWEQWLLHWKGKSCTVGVVHP